MVWPKHRPVSREYVEALADTISPSAADALARVVEEGIEDPEFYEDNTGIHLKEKEQ
jgi:hypothetical protein